MAIKNNGVVIANQLKSLYKDFYDDNGNLRGSASGNSSELPIVNQTLMKMVFQLIFKYKIVNEEMRIYIRYADKNYRQVTDMVLGNNVPDDYEDNSKKYYANTYNKIRNSCIKLAQLFGDSFIVDLCYMTINVNIDRYAQRIGKVYAEHNGSDTLADSLVVDIPKNVLFNYCDSFRFKNMLEQLRPYSKKAAAEAVEKLDKQAIGYLNYLVATEGHLTDEDEDNLSLAKQILGVDEQDTKE